MLLLLSARFADEDLQRYFSIAMALSTKIEPVMWKVGESFTFCWVKRSDGDAHRFRLALIKQTPSGPLEAQAAGTMTSPRRESHEQWTLNALASWRLGLVRLTLLTEGCQIVMQSIQKRLILISGS